MAIRPQPRVGHLGLVFYSESFKIPSHRSYHCISGVQRWRGDWPIWTGNKLSKAYTLFGIGYHQNLSFHSVPSDWKLLLREKSPPHWKDSGGVDKLGRSVLNDLFRIEARSRLWSIFVRGVPSRRRYLWGCPICRIFRQILPKLWNKRCKFVVGFHANI